MLVDCGDDMDHEWRMSWQQAVAALTAERERAETAARIVKRLGDAAAVARAERAYGDGKAETDAIVAALTVALAENREPETGHGAQVGDDLYLLPHGIGSASTAAVRTHGLSVEELGKCLAGIAAHGAVLVLLDACRAGAFDAGLLRERLKQPQVAVLTSSRGTEVSVERDDLENGVFTEAFLDALEDADFDRNGVIGIADLQAYLDTHVRRLTDEAQTPGIEVRFQREIFAVAL
jgi:uncharacterized caspase-like protein